MIDLHSHILPALDDGAPNLQMSLGMAMAAIDDGVDTIAATPHVNPRWDVHPIDVAQAVGQLNVALARLELPLAVLPGAEIGLDVISDLDRQTIAQLTLGGSTCVMVEPPYSGRAPFLEDVVFNLQVQGFRPMIAHPERVDAFRTRPERLAALSQRGVLACVNAGSLHGAFGAEAQEAALTFMTAGIVDVVASDAHDDNRRPPTLKAAFSAADEHLPGLAEQREYFTKLAPAAVLASAPLPERPPLLTERRTSRIQRLFGRSRP